MKTPNHQSRFAVLWEQSGESVPVTRIEIIVDSAPAENIDGKTESAMKAAPAAKPQPSPNRRPKRPFVSF